MAKTVEFLDNRYELYILPQAKQKMEMYCDLSEGEIGWLAFVEKFDTQGFLITDCALLKQEVHSTTTEITPEGLLEFWNNTPAEKQSLIKLWGHSHVNMSPSPSSQDNEQMDYFKDNNPWFIRLITNKKREYYIDIYDYANGLKIHMDQADLITYNPGAKELRESIEAEIKEKVSKKEATYSKSYGSGTYTNPYYDRKKNERGTTKSTTKPMLEDIDVKYVTSFTEVLNDPNYWQNILGK